MYILLVRDIVVKISFSIFMNIVFFFLIQFCIILSSRHCCCHARNDLTIYIDLWDRAQICILSGHLYNTERLKLFKLSDIMQAVLQFQSTASVFQFTFTHSLRWLFYPVPGVSLSFSLYIYFSPSLSSSLCLARVSFSLCSHDFHFSQLCESFLPRVSFCRRALGKAAAAAGALRMICGEHRLYLFIPYHIGRACKSRYETAILQHSCVLEGERAFQNDFLVAPFRWRRFRPWITQSVKLRKCTTNFRRR